MAEWLSSLPLYWAKVFAAIGFAGMLVWAWFRPRSFIFAGAPDQSRWRDLRIWATVCMVIQIIVYLVF